MPGPRINEYQIEIIKRTGNPVAPLIMNELYNKAESFSNVLILEAKNNGRTGEQLQDVSVRLLQDFTDPELENLCGKPEFILSLLVMLKSSLIRYAHESVDPNYSTRVPYNPSNQVYMIDAKSINADVSNCRNPKNVQQLIDRNSIFTNMMRGNKPENAIPFPVYVETKPAVGDMPETTEIFLVTNYARYYAFRELYPDSQVPVRFLDVAEKIAIQE